MSTIYTFHQECTELAEPMDPADVLLVYDTSAGCTKRLTAARVSGAGAGVVDTTATTLTVTAASHAGKTITLSSTSPIAVTLPQATGTGNRYRFVVLVTATATAHTIAVANATDVMKGFVHAMTTSSDNVIGYKTSATSDTISLNGTTKGGYPGDWFEIVDVKSGVFSIHGNTEATGTTATPFSAAVS